MECINESCMCYNERENNNCDSGKDIIDCGNAELAEDEKQINESDWNYIDSNTPISVLLNRDIEIQRKINTVYHPIIKGDPREKIIIGLLEGVKYRYRLKPLESIRITREMNDLIYYDNKDKVSKISWNMNDEIVNFNGREVEILE